MKFRIEKEYMKIGLVAFLVIAASIAVYFTFEKADALANVVSTVTNILGPFIYGLVMAYLLCPIYNLTFRKLTGSSGFKRVFKRKSSTAAKVFSSTVAILTMTAVIVGLLWMVLPGLIESISGIIKMLPGKINEISNHVSELMKNMPDKSGGFVARGIANVQKWAENTILPNSEILIHSFSNGIFGVLSGLKNFLVGVIICVFFLNSKDIFAAQSRKIVFVTMKEENANKFLYGARYVNRTFGKFINGKLIDSLIIGIICFVGMSVFDWPYKMLISVIVGVTNIIPFFGPFIGAIPSALLILIIDPLTCLYFLVFILALQQLDGNVIGPKILGESTGLPSFWVMFAILVGGGLFGFVGMVIGIPVFACIYAYTAYTVNRKLEKKGFTTDLNAYKELGEKLSYKVDKDIEEIAEIESKQRESFNEQK